MTNLLFSHPHFLFGGVALTYRLFSFLYYLCNHNDAPLLRGATVMCAAAQRNRHSLYAVKW